MAIAADITASGLLVAIGYLLIIGSPVWIPILLYVRTQRKNPSVKVMAIEELVAAGFTAKEAIVEQRRQRQEARDHVRTSTNAIRASLKAAHLARRLTKKL